MLYNSFTFTSLTSSYHNLNHFSNLMLITLLYQQWRRDGTKASETPSRQNLHNKGKLFPLTIQKVS